MEDIVEEVVEPVVEAIETAGNGVFFVGLGVGLIVGSTIGYIAARIALKTKYDNLAQEEISEMRTYFRDQQKATEARLKAPITEVVEYLGYKKAEDETSTDPDSDFHPGSEQQAPDPTSSDHARAVAENTARNVFDRNTATDHVWDYAVEAKLRSSNPGRPFVIHLDEYGEEDYQTVCYTYYEGDEILADERDEVVDNVDELIGLTNLTRFGQGSDNINILLIRNKTLKMDIEIAKSNGDYASDVQGFLQHNYGVEKMPKRHQDFDDDA